MAARRNYAAIGFKRNRRGPLERGTAQVCLTADEARKQAEKLSCRKGYAGAIAFVCSDLDDQDPITIAAFGEVPPEARDNLPY